jgi:hypothetical protein
LHGAVEASGSAVDRSARATHGVGLPRCDRFPTQAQRGACAHGFGHALMLRTANDLRASIDGCRAAALRGLARVPCERGVMMQNSLRFSGRADYALASARGCRIAGAQRLRELCFENVGVVAALSLGHDDDRAAASCRRLAREPERAHCLNGVTAEIAEALR